MANDDTQPMVCRQAKERRTFMRRRVFCAVVACLFLPVSALAQSESVPTQDASVVATGTAATSNGGLTYTTFVVVTNTGVVKFCRANVTGGPADCVTIP